MGHVRTKFSISRAVLFATSMATGTLACNGDKEAKKTTDSTAASKSIATDSLAADTSSLTTTGTIAFSGYPGRLGGEDETKDYLAKMVFNRPANADDYVDREVECDEDDGCSGSGNGRRRIVIIPEANAHLVDWETALDPSSPRKGYIVASVTNRGNRSRRWQLGRNETLYVWVGPIDGGYNRGVRFYRIIPETGVVANTLRARQVRKCDPIDATRTNVPRAQIFRGIDGHCMGKPGDKLLYPRSVDGREIKIDPTVPGNSGLWFSCSSGCCESTRIN